MYNFDEIINRRGTGSFKWDEAREGVLPMWVADMDFAVAPCIQEAIRRRAQHPIFGYVSVPDAYYDAVIGWYGRRHGWTIERDSIIYTTGVVPAVSAILQAVIQPGEKVIVQTPAYNCFFSSIRNSGAQLCVNPLRRVALNAANGAAADGKEGCGVVQFTYELDLEHLERCCADDAAKVLIMCNPHNPSGRLWTREELLSVAEICRRHDVMVIADEIHNELSAPGTSYCPWGTLGAEYQENAVVCVSASKSFNIAGLQMANIVCANPRLRSRINKRININETCDVGPFGYPATIAAFSDDGAAWLDALRDYLWGNYRAFCDFFAAELPQLPVARLEATYLVWVDVTTLAADGETSEDVEEHLNADHNLWVNAGEHYGEAYEEGARRYLRFNIACPRAQMLEGLRRFAAFAAR